MVTSSSYTLKFIVTGGGITGLTCAYLLKKGGHEVVVLEKLSHDELLNVSFMRGTKTFHLSPPYPRFRADIPYSLTLFSCIESGWRIANPPKHDKVAARASGNREAVKGESSEGSRVRPSSPFVSSIQRFFLARLGCSSTSVCFRGVFALLLHILISDLQVKATARQSSWVRWFSRRR